MARQALEHRPEVDRVKGFAILCVVAIHAKIGAGTIVHDHVVDRAVPIFLLVFGMMSELSWRRAKASGRSLGAWYGARLRRLFPAIWGAAALWWLAVVVTTNPPLQVDALDAALTFVGYSPWIGPSWFVTLVLELVVLFPALHFVVERAPPVVALGLAAALTAFAAWSTLHVVDFGLRMLGDKVIPPGWFYTWIFPPRVVWLVVSGIIVARVWGTRLPVRVTLIAAVLAAFVVPAVTWVNPEEFVVGALRRTVVMHLFDVPVALTVLGIAGAVGLPAVVARFIEWCGRHSWGLYLGHVAVFETVHMLGRFPEGGPQGGRLLYGLFLLAAGAVLVALGQRILTSTPFSRFGEAP